MLHKNFCHFEPLSEGANSILEKFPSLLQCFGPDLIPPLTSLRSVKGDTRRTGNADEDVETKRELLGKKVNKEKPQLILKRSETPTRNETTGIFHQAYSKIQYKLFYGHACFSHQNGEVDGILYLMFLFFDAKNFFFYFLFEIRRT